MTRLSRKKPCWIFSSILVLPVLLWTCASVTPTMTTIKMYNLEYALDDARKADAGSYAPLDLQFAEDKYQKARTAMTDRHYGRAEQLMDEAEVDAQVAREKALAAKAEKDVHEMLQSIETLSDEAERIKNQKTFY